MIQLTILRNILLSEPRYRQDLADVRVSLERIGDPIIELLRIETPSSNPAPRDDSLQFFKENQSPHYPPRLKNGSPQLHWVIMHYQRFSMAGATLSKHFGAKQAVY